MSKKDKIVSAATYSRQLNMLNKLYMSNDYENIQNSDEKHEWISKLLDLISTQRQNPGVSQSQLNRMEEDLTSRLILIPAAEIAVHAGIVHERTKFKNGETNANMHLLGLIPDKSPPGTEEPSNNEVRELLGFPTRDSSVSDDSDYGTNTLTKGYVPQWRKKLNKKIMSESVKKTQMYPKMNQETQEGVLMTLMEMMTCPI